ncbi:cysteine proteinase, partial [Coemansia reversa NRRL 1564]
MPAPTCFTCGTPADRLHVCLTCDFFGCWRRGQAHIAEHLQTTRHPFALDFVQQQVYCGACGDYVYDAGISSWLLGTQIRWHAAICDAAEPEAKRPRIVSTGADLSPAQAKYVREHGSVLPCGGVRGLLNLGATCFLSAVVQALAHNPLVRGWMLSDGHHPTPACMACELESAFQALYSGAKTPFAPVGLLHALWQLRGDLAGYGQQDAHECLVALLDTLHVGFTENLHTHTHLRPCPCLVHQAFAGVLQSTVTCARCGNATVAHDPILDISLDIPDTSLTRGRFPVTTLDDCLAHYTRVERLPPAAYVCSRCRAPSAAATKQLCLKELPPVLTFQLKRFGHRRPASATAKINAFVRLPLHIDMTPATLGKRRTDATHSNPACAYRLFAVINHIGQLDSGHYTAYALHRGQWFFFDDASVSRADVRDVLAFSDEANVRAGRPPNGRAYMAFYVKSTLDYHD